MCWLTCVCGAHNACAAHRPGAAAAAATADRNNDLAHLLVQLTFFVVYCRRRRSGQRTRFRRGRDRRLEPHDACALRLLRLHIVLPSPWRKCVIRARACIALLRICIRVCARLGIALEWLHCACAGVSTTAPTPTPMAATPAATISTSPPPSISVSMRADGLALAWLLLTQLAAGDVRRPVLVVLPGLPIALVKGEGGGPCAYAACSCARAHRGARVRCSPGMIGGGGVCAFARVAVGVLRRVATAALAAAADDDGGDLVCTQLRAPPHPLAYEDWFFYSGI
ncbi:hypothetical protein K438DRAFT_1052588 [Mycena galopus ATCC 62051]|nr:hypothetical protein K438DRAFT_1052588 [Mycena galopus ATCC 62051]